MTPLGGGEPWFLYYACGGGLGHVVRTLSLARQVRKRLGGQQRILFNTPLSAAFEKMLIAENLRLGEEAFIGRFLPPTADQGELRKAVAAELNGAPTAAIIDCFPRGILGEFAAAEGPNLAWPELTRNVLVSRTLPAQYVNQFKLPEWVRAHFGLVVVPGEASPLEAHHPCVRTAPFLLRNASELPSRLQAAARLNVDPVRGAVIYMLEANLNQTPDLLKEVAQLAEQWPDKLPPLRVVGPCTEMFEIPSVVQPLLATANPLLELLPAAAAVVGAAGYNLVHEAVAVGVPAWLRPVRRQYDDQFGRAARSGSKTWNEVSDLLESLSHAILAPPSAIGYLNGAELAATRIAALVASTPDSGRV